MPLVLRKLADLDSRFADKPAFGTLRGNFAHMVRQGLGRSVKNEYLHGQRFAAVLPLGKNRVEVEKQIVTIHCL